MKQKKYFLLLILALFLPTVIFAGCSNDNQGEQSESDTSVNETQNALSGNASELGSLKSFTAVNLDGDELTQADFAGADITVINFWTTTCGPCIQEMPSLAEFSNSLPENVRVMTVCLDGIGQEDYVKELLGDFSGETLVSGDGDFLNVCQNILYTPTTIFVDSEGQLIGDTIIGAQESLSQVYFEAIDELLSAMGKEEITVANQ